MSSSHLDLKSVIVCRDTGLTASAGKSQVFTYYFYIQSTRHCREQTTRKGLLGYEQTQRSIQARKLWRQHQIISTESIYSKMPWYRQSYRTDLDVNGNKDGWWLGTYWRLFRDRNWWVGRKDGDHVPYHDSEYVWLSAEDIVRCWGGVFQQVHFFFLLKRGLNGQ